MKKLEEINRIIGFLTKKRKVLGFICLFAAFFSMMAVFFLGFNSLFFYLFFIFTILAIIFLQKNGERSYKHLTSYYSPHNPFSAHNPTSIRNISNPANPISYHYRNK